jgi:hypothetical protein
MLKKDLGGAAPKKTAAVAGTRDCRRSSPASGAPRTRVQGRSMPLRLSTACAASDRGAMSDKDTKNVLEARDGDVVISRPVVAQRQATPGSFNERNAPGRCQQGPPVGSLNKLARTYTYSHMFRRPPAETDMQCAERHPGRLQHSVR